MRIKALLLLSAFLLLSACQLAPQPTSSPSPTPPVATPTPSPTLLSAPVAIEAIELRPLGSTGRNPRAIAVLNGRLYVANWDTGNVSAIENDEVVATIPVGIHPSAIAADPASRRLYVANQGDGSLTIIEDDWAVATVPVAEEPDAVAVLDGRVYVGCYGESVIVVLDGETGERVSTISLDTPGGILSLATDPLAKRLYANTYGQTHVIEAETLEVSEVITLDSYRTLALNPFTGRIYVNDYDPAQAQQYLVAIERATKALVARTPIGIDPLGAAVNPKTNHIYVANSHSNNVTVIEGATNEVIATIPVGMEPVAVAVDTAANRIYVANAKSDSVSVVDGESNEVVRIIPLAITPQGVAANPQTGHIYVANPSTDSVFVLEGEEILMEIPVGRHPMDVAINPITNRIYVVNHVEGTASVIAGETNEVIATVPVGDRPRGAAVNPANNRVYIAGAVIDGETNEVVGEIRLKGANPYSMEVPTGFAIDREANRLYAVASNGVPGSNWGMIVYVVNGATHQQLSSGLGGTSVTALALDPAVHRLYIATTRLIEGRYFFQAFDTVNEERVFSMELDSEVHALVVNPNTQHIFLARDDGQIDVLDARHFSLVATLAVGREPRGMAVLDDRVYVTSQGDGTVTIIQDCEGPFSR